MKTKVFEPGAICAAARYSPDPNGQCARPKAWMRDVIFPPDNVDMTS